MHNPKTVEVPLERTSKALRLGMTSIFRMRYMIRVRCHMMKSVIISTIPLDLSLFLQTLQQIFRSGCVTNNTSCVANSDSLSKFLVLSFRQLSQ